MFEYTKEINDLIELRRQRHNEYWNLYINRPIFDRDANSEVEIQRLKSKEEEIQKTLFCKLSKFYGDIAISIQPKDICFQYIFDDSKTTQILDNFRYAPEGIMMLRDVFKTNSGQWISLIVTEYDWNLELAKDKAPTMTEVKMSLGKCPNDYYPGRLIHLIEEIYDVVDENAYYPDRTRFALKEPCPLKGQDSNNRDTYGDTWSYMVIGVEITKL